MKFTYTYLRIKVTGFTGEMKYFLNNIFCVDADFWELQKCMYDGDEL